MKIIVTGNKGCSRCDITKKILQGKKIDFEYQVLADLNTQEQKAILERAKDKGIVSLPIIDCDGELRNNVQEVLELCK